MKELWGKFDELSSKAYSDRENEEASMENWDAGFDVLMEIVAKGRSRSRFFVRKLDQIDESTKGVHDVNGWLEDYLEELAVNGRYGQLEKVCGKLLETFDWDADSPSDLRFQMATALGSQGKQQEALKYCEEWYGEDTEDVTAAAALIYARIAVKDFEGAQKLVDQYITEDGHCTEDNDEIYMAASLLYKVTGNTQAETKINQELASYEEELEKYFS